MDIHMDIHIWVPRDPCGGSMDTLGGPMGPWDRWDRWDLGLMDPRYFLRGYFCGFSEIGLEGPYPIIRNPDQAFGFFSKKWRFLLVN